MNSRLPVSPEQVDTRFFLNQLPHCITHYPFMNGFSDAMNDFMPLIVGYLLKDIQDASETSCGHTFLANMALPDFEVNPDFNDALAMAAELVEMRLWQDNVPPTNSRLIEQIIAETVPIVTNIAAAMQVNKYPAIDSYMAASEVDAVDQVLAAAGQIQREIQAYHRERAALENDRGGHRPTMSRGSSMRNNFGNQTNMTQQRSMGGNAFAMRTTRGAAPNSPARVSATTVFGAQKNHTNNQPEEVAKTAPRVGFGAMAFNNRKVNAEPVRAERTPTPTRATRNHPAQQAFKRVANSIDESITEAIAVVDGTRSFTMDRPYAYAFNPKTELPFYGKTENGKFIEAFIRTSEVTDAMTSELKLDYFEHEINHTFRAAVKRDIHERRDQGIVVNALNGIAEPLNFSRAIVQRQEAVKEDESKDLDMFSLPVIVETEIFANEVHGALSEVGKLLVKNGFDVDAFTECQFTETTEYHLKAHEAFSVLELRDLLNEADSNAGSFSQDTYRAFVGKFDEIKSKLVHDTWWYETQQKLTGIVNEVLVTTIPLSWDIASFSDDAVELIELMEQKHSSALVDDFCEEVITIIESLFANMTVLYVNVGDDVDIVQRNLEEEEAVDLEAMVCLRHNTKCSVSKFPVKSFELDIAFASKKEKAGLVLSKRYPVLANVLERLYERNSNTLRTRYIYTEDGVLMRVYRGAIGDTVKQYLLGKID